MTTEQVPLRQLLSDPIYREWLRTPPVGGFPEWARFRVYAKVEENRPWARKDFDTFVEAYNFLARNLKNWYDAALISTNYESRPPVVRINKRRQYLASVLSVPGHQWCGQCRRPTVFGYFRSHHAFSGLNFKPLPYKKRCGICGMAQDNMKRYSVKGEVS